MRGELYIKAVACAALLGIVGMGCKSNDNAGLTSIPSFAGSGNNPGGGNPNTGSGNENNTGGLPGGNPNGNGPNTTGTNVGGSAAAAQCTQWRCRSPALPARCGSSARWSSR